MTDSVTPASPSLAAASAADPGILPPAPSLLMAEMRLLGEIAWFLKNARTAFADLPRGQGQAVLVIPGFGASDWETRGLRSALKGLGYETFGWGFKRNLGMRASIRVGMAERVRELSARHGPITIVGWSLGGVFARELARAMPEHVAQVFTLGSPITGDPDANNMSRLFRLANPGLSDEDPAKTRRAFEKRSAVVPGVPCVALYSKTDGIVAWQCCLEPEAPTTENVEVTGSHMGLVVNPDVVRAIASRMAERAGMASEAASPT